MEQTFEALGGILLKAIPTVLIVLFLHFYLKFMLFAPLRRVLKQREEMTAGARQAAESSLAKADTKAREYEDKLNQARTEVYKQQEDIRRQWLQDQAAQAAEARVRVGARVKEARAQIEAESGTARQDLRNSSEALADQIATRILAKGAGGAA